MKGFLGIAGAFLRREMLSIHPLRWVVECLDASLSVVIWYFATRLFGRVSLFQAASPADYFTFSLIGVALSQYVWRGFSALSSRVRSELWSGAFESWWMASYPLPLLVVLSALWDFLAATVNAGVLLAVGIYGFGADLNWKGMLVVMGVGLMTSLAMSFLGLLSISWSMVSRQGDLLRPVINKVLPVASGAFFPVALFPLWLQGLSQGLPLTHSLTIARGVLMPDTGLAVAEAWWRLGMVTVLLGAVGWGSFSLCLRWARMNGRIVAR